MPVEMKQGTILTCECCGALFEVKKPCTCQQVQDFICSCGEKLVQARK
jgi:hypothetical protein